MITIDLSDNGRTQRLFGDPSLDLSHWLEAPYWTMEEAVAISLGYEPDRLQLGLILMKCPEEIRDRPLRGSPQVLYRLCDLVQMYLGRLSLLERAAEMEELPAKRIDGKYKLKPFDFLRWFSAQTGGNWNYTPLAMTGMVEALVANDTEKEEHPRTSRRKGRQAALNYLIFHMKKSPNCPLCEKRTELRQRLMDKFNIGKNIVDEVIKEAEELTKSDWYKRGRPSTKVYR